MGIKFTFIMYFILVVYFLFYYEGCVSIFDEFVIVFQKNIK